MDKKILVTLKGKPIITVEDLEKEKECWYQDPQLGSLDDREYFDSEAFVQNCLNGLIHDKIAEEYALRYKMREPIEYQTRLDHAIRMLHRELLRETVEIPVSEDEMRALYEQWSSDKSCDLLYEEISEDLKRYLEKTKFRNCLEEKIEQLKKEYDVKVNLEIV